MRLTCLIAATFLLCPYSTADELPIKDAACVCPLLFEPVCASDGTTYENSCSFECVKKERHLEGITIAALGSCDDSSIDNNDNKASCFCPRIFDPVCASDGETYENTCVFDCAKKERNHQDITIVALGSCADIIDDEPKCICPLLFEPVCASDGVTYENPCLLECAKNEKDHEDITVLSLGSCSDVDIKDDEPKCLCSFIYEPVCASDGVTYDNPCLLECAKKQKDHEDITVLSLGTCDELNIKDDEPKCICPLLFEPVCASDGVTYENPCLLECAKKEKDHEDITVLSLGSCDDVNIKDEPICICPFLFEPVCASDGVTYENPCLFECAKKEKNHEDITVLSLGSCSGSNIDI